MTEVLLRRATVDDVPAIAAHEQRIFEADAWSEDLVREEITGQHRVYLVLEREGAVVGYGGSLVVGGDGDIQTIAVTDEVRGTGQGRRLFDALVGEAQRLGAKRIFLEVRADNPSAIGMYERSGFVEIGRREKYYRHDGVDAIIMLLELQDRDEQNREAGE